MVTSNAFNREESAEHWAIRLDAGALSDDESRALDDWLQADDRRAGALLRAEAALAYLDRGRALAMPQDGARPSPGATGRRRFLLVSALSGLAAAGLIAFIGIGGQPVTINTAVGELRRVPLADGSIAAVNTDSKLDVEFLDRRRNVRLYDGEVWFQVSHDSKRPFVVTAGDVRVQAVGTAFSVRRRPDGVDVLVTEGAVETWIAGRESQRARIAAGFKSFVVDAAPAIRVVEAGDEIDRQLAWRTGELALNGESLAYAASELNRYNQRKLIIEGQELSQEPLVGYFRTDQPENFGRAAAELTGARIVVDGEAIRLRR